MSVSGTSLPEVSGAVPNHLLLLQRQSLNDAFAVIDKLTAQSLLHIPHGACSVRQVKTKCRTIVI